MTDSLILNSILDDIETNEEQEDQDIRWSSRF